MLARAVVSKSLRHLVHKVGFYVFKGSDFLLGGRMCDIKRYEILSIVLAFQS